MNNATKAAALLAEQSVGSRHERAPMLLDEKAIEVARHEHGHSALAPHDQTFRTDLVKFLNDSLATELLCVLRYKRHYFTAQGLASPRIAEEFLVHANKESVHADRIAKRIVQLGGEPDFCPDTLSRRSHASYDESKDLREMIRANFVAERVAIESYSQLIALVGDQDSTTRRMLEDILSDEEEHAEELKGWLTETEQRR